MAKYDEEPKGDVRPVPGNEKEKFQNSNNKEKRDNPESSLSQDARRHAESKKHGKR